MHLVIGSTGFIGRHLVKALAAQHPGQVRALVRPGKQTVLAGIKGVELVEGDVTDRASLDKAMTGVTTLFHFAAITGNIKNTNNIYWKVNVEGTRNSVAAAEKAGVRRIILGGGLGTVEGKEGSYMRTRWLMEEAVRQSKLEYTILQPSILFGEGSEFFEAQARIMKLLPVAALIGGGKTRFQPIFVDDVVKAVILTAEQDDKIGKTIELGGPEYYTYTELVNLILRTIHKKRLKLPLPLWAMSINAALFSVLPKPPFTPAMVELFSFDNVTPDPQIIEHEFGFKPIGLKPYLAEHGIKA
ncbi:MAG: NAD(P)H-binding protein [Chloroflexi bacterium]|nr:NAD(P)H-binding protein [Chloroflexota bacterium]OJV93237.1 MAG: hypothetical protein BGO39_14840 [Chloroflexi bacterium 54-19]